MQAIAILGLVYLVPMVVSAVTYYRRVHSARIARESAIDWSEPKTVEIYIPSNRALVYGEVR